ncbi:MAG: AAA family ATPase [Clostridia bacterium]|nr:AAA family ATPase [Clostridia bacterium]
MQTHRPRAFSALLMTLMLLSMLLFSIFRPAETSDQLTRILLTLLLTSIPLLFFLTSRREPARGFVTGASSLTECGVPSTRFADVAANDEALESLRDLIDFIKEPEKFSHLGARIPRGVLLYGMPGTGKTLMARALAGEAGVPFFAVNGADFVEMYVGVGASRVRALFQKARKAGRAVIFFDEIDAIGKKRTNQNDEREQTLNALLSEMSGFRDGDGIVVLAATNRVDTLDDALLRPGRFDRRIEVPLPSLSERLKILEVHARNKPLSADVSLQDVAAETALFSGARLESLLNEAAIVAAKRSGTVISQDDLDKAMDTMLFGMDRPGGLNYRQEKEQTAAHEAGHALLTALLLPESAIRKVSIIPTGKGAAGYSMAIPPEKLFYQKRELLSHIAVALAGREAEKLYSGDDNLSTGAANDIEKAAGLAQRMVCEWGMMPGGTEAYLFSQAQRENAQQQWLDMGQQLAAGMLRRHMPAWQQLTRLLLEKETLGKEDILRCLTDFPRQQ